MTDGPWEYNDTTREYILVQGAWHATVWHTTVDGWAAGIAGPDIIDGQAHFPTRDDAQAWALKQLDTLCAQGKC